MGGSRMGYFTNDPNYRFLSTGNPVGQSNYSVARSFKLTFFHQPGKLRIQRKILCNGNIEKRWVVHFWSENRFGWFPSISAAWRVREENFMKGWEWLTEFKLRASWGKTGFHGNTDPFNQYSLYGGGPGDAYYDINGTSNSTQQGFRVVRIGNPRTGWQEDIVTNIGFESLFWNGKLSLTVDWYNKTSTGSIIPGVLASFLGDVTPPNVNVGNVKNTGIDILLGSKGNFSKDWSWDVLVTFSQYDNKIVKLNGLPFIDDFTTLYGSYIRNEVGHPISSFFGYKIIGLIPGCK